MAVGYIVNNLYATYLQYIPITLSTMERAKTHCLGHTITWLQKTKEVYLANDRKK